MGTLTVADELTGRVNFTFSTVSPLTLVTIAPGNTIYEVQVVITTPFDDPAATVTVGTVASPALVLQATDTKIQNTDQWLTEEAFVIALSEILRLTINPGASTQGAGYVLYRVRR